jgi:arylsulfatase A-like enzyme
MNSILRSILSVLALVVWQGVANAAPQPNIVLIVADDLGWNDVGNHNERMRTPRLDQLAAEGVQFDRHYVTPVCTPTRVCLMTGRHPSRFNVHSTQPSNEQAFPIGTPTLASALQEAGYETALAGKWHLGSKPEWGPNHHGFDHSYGSLAGAVGMYDHRYRIGTPFEKTWHRDHEYIDEEGHATDLITAEAVRLIEQPRKKPLFLYVPFHSVHTPLVEEQKYLDRVSHIENADRRLYAAAVNHLDECIGRIVDAVEQSGKLESTLIVFTSDNGAQVNHSGNQYPPPDPKLVRFSSNKPLRGKKAEVYEGGIRVPALVYWPGTLSPRVCEAPLHAVDWLPTLSKLVGGQVPAEVPLDGMDVWSVVAGEKRPSPRTLYWSLGEGPRQVAVRDGDWKLLRAGPNRPWELFNLKDDPYEEKNLADSQPEQLARMQEILAEEQSKDAAAKTATPAEPARP